MTTERAPVAGPQTTRGGRSGGGNRSLLEGLVDPRGGANNAMVQQLLRGNRSPFAAGEPQTPGNPGTGAAAGAGVLTAVDEDGEDDEDAPLPKEFEYFSDVDEDEDDEDDDDDE